MPSVFVVGTVHDRLTLPLAGGGAEDATWILKGVSAADCVPSLTLITMFENVPTFVLDGVPVNAPVATLKLAQDGMFWTLKLSVVPEGPLAVGVKE